MQLCTMLKGHSVVGGGMHKLNLSTGHIESRAYVVGEPLIPCYPCVVQRRIGICHFCDRGCPYGIYSPGHSDLARHIRITTSVSHVAD
jgi:hypothetical protein